MRSHRHNMILPLLALLLAASDPTGWSSAHWGMTEDQILAAFPDQAVRVSGSAADAYYRCCVHADVSCRAQSMRKRVGLRLSWEVQPALGCV
jgi:hypothetical protein